MTSIENLTQWLQSNIEDLEEYVLANDSDSEYFAGVQSGYASVYAYLTGESLETTELPDQF